jgi:hypothetical protein
MNCQTENTWRSRDTVARRSIAAFSLIEVMIALAIFFMAAFTILALISTVLKNARIIQNHKSVDASMVAGQLMLTNKMVEGVESGDFGDIYRGFTWTTDTEEVASNGLFRVSIIVERDGGRVRESEMAVLFYRPESQPGSMSGGRRGFN